MYRIVMINFYRYFQFFDSVYSKQKRVSYLDLLIKSILNYVFDT